jgi:hypothetical protein
MLKAMTTSLAAGSLLWRRDWANRNREATRDQQAERLSRFAVI